MKPIVLNHMYVLYRL